MLGASILTMVPIMKVGANTPTSPRITATSLNHLVSQHQQVVFSSGSPSRPGRAQLHSSSRTSPDRGSHSSSHNASMPNRQQPPSPDTQMTELKNILQAFMTTSQTNFARMDQNITSLKAGQRNQGAIL
ncbi:unnamed protein product [Linum trigynum]|uniref:Uncharacterized protein n=1 Tax=Linum trigynum TaxID=586398 RepID=A0AAV2CW18_9ROSI